MAETPQYDQSLTIALLRARDAVTALFREHVAAAGLTLQQWRVIRALAGGHELDTTTLSDRLDPSLAFQELLREPEAFREEAFRELLQEA